MSDSLRDHWNKKYIDSPITKLGWYESNSSTSIQLIENCAVPKSSIIADVGSGATTLTASLLELGYQEIYCIDISEVALEKAKALLDKEMADQVHWLVDDITNPSTMQQLNNVAIWHDRAVFHFLTEDRDRSTYHSLLQKIVGPGGFVIMATFAINGSEKCSGLPVQRYNAESLSEFLGDGFDFIESVDHTYQMPSGDLRPFVYVRFQKI